MERPEMLPCKCGGKPRFRRSGDFCWVECSRKKTCEKFSGYVHNTDPKSFDQTECDNFAIRLWNDKMKKK